MTKPPEHLESNVAGTCTQIPQGAAVLSAPGLSSVPSVSWKADFCGCIAFLFGSANKRLWRETSKRGEVKAFGPPVPPCGATVLAGATL